MMMMTPLLLLLACIVSTTAFRGSFFSSRNLVRRFMADDAAVEALRAKMAADPNYNPMNDPQAQQVRVIC
jgi:hypothetical protein